MTSQLKSAIAARKVVRVLTLAAALTALPGVVQAQSGKWIATISVLSTVGGAADITVDPRNEKQSRAKISLRSSKRETRIAWDIVVGRCRDEGPQITAQAAFTQIQTGMDGTGTSNANVPKLESGKNYYVRVFDPQTIAADATAYGCGNLVEKP